MKTVKASKKLIKKKDSAGYFFMDRNGLSQHGQDLQIYDFTPVIILSNFKNGSKNGIQIKITL